MITSPVSKTLKKEIGFADGNGELVKIVMNITMRYGATTAMVRDTVNHLYIAARTLAHGNTKVEEKEYQKRTPYPYVAERHDEVPVSIFADIPILINGKRHWLPINRFDHTASAQDAVDMAWAFMAALKKEQPEETETE
jgi:hypothetical protein